MYYKFVVKNITERYSENEKKGYYAKLCLFEKERSRQMLEKDFGLPVLFWLLYFLLIQNKIDLFFGTY